MSLVSLDQVSVAYGDLPLLDRASLRLDSGERVCVIGRNGSGKSTLLQLLSGAREPDSGTIHRSSGVQTALLVQDVPLSSSRPVFDVVAEGLGELGDLATAYHHAALRVAEAPSPTSLETLGRLQQALEDRDGWRLGQRVESVIQRLQLPAEAVVDTLSGGWRRRVLLAKALVVQPDLLLLDEPTNHLDLEAIDWLETLVTGYVGVVVVVTHDRVFLERVATRIVELDRGRLTSWSGNYAHYLRRQEERLIDETVRQAKQDRKLAAEEAWLRQGIKARRTRNEGRVRALMALRAERAQRRIEVGNVALQIESATQSGKMVIEAEAISCSFDGRVVITDFTTRILRGDRVGLIGRNGAGKTTLLRLLLGELQPGDGEIRRGTNVQVAYFDQQREQLDPERTVFDTVGDGNDTVVVDGESRHVYRYLRDFLFSRDRARSPVKALSGGERNRLLLARLFTRPANLLVLDEPTNDLDVETLELLEARLAAWSGTLLLVTHDRAFLDHVVTSTLVFEGEGRVSEYVGGYSDWVSQCSGSVERVEAARPSRSRKIVGLGSTPDTSSDCKKRLSYHEQRELVALPTRIESLEAETEKLNATVSEPDFYRETSGMIETILARLEKVRSDLDEAYARWEALEERRGGFRG